MYRTTSWGVPGSTELALGFDRSGSPWVNAIPHVVEAMATSATANVAVIRSLRPGRHIRWRELGTQRLVDDGLSDYPEAGSSIAHHQEQLLSISNIGTDRDPRELSLWRASAEFLDGPVVASALIDRL